MSSQGSLRPQPAPTACVTAISPPRSARPLPPPSAADPPAPALRTSYGAVYKCTRSGDGLPYAMKQINTRNMSHKERQDAVNEIRILASVVNPYVIRFCEAFVEDDMLYIITEYANHGDLFKRLQRLKQRHQSLPEDACWIYFIQLCLGVQALHRNSILHRDLKSANVFLASHNRLKIGDLGVAKLLRAQEAYAKTQIGTPYYVSPELWKNKPYNSKSDVWALGCLLYEMVELKPPFDSTNMRGLASVATPHFHGLRSDRLQNEYADNCCLRTGARCSVVSTRRSPAATLLRSGR